MRTVKVDNNGKIQWNEEVEGVEAILQGIRIFLYTEKGEWLYYQYHGIDYDNSLLTIKPNIKMTSEYLEKEIKNLYPQVNSFTLLNLERDGADGLLSYKIVINNAEFTNEIKYEL